MKGQRVLVGQGFLSLLLASSTAFAAEVDCPTRNMSTESLGGGKSSEVGAYRPGDIVGIRDPKNPGEFVDVIIIDEFVTTEDKGNGYGSDTLKQRQYTVLVPPTTPGGESTVMVVDIYGKSNGTPGTLPEYVNGQLERHASHLRNSKALAAITQRQLQQAGAKLTKLNETTEQFNQRYATAEGLTRLTAEIAIAIAVDELKNTALPDQYKNLDKESTDAINSIVKPTLDVIGDVAKKGVNGTEGKRVEEAAVDAGIAGTAGYTFGPVLDQLEKAGKFGVPGSKDAKKTVDGINAILKGIVKAGVAGQQADEGEGVREAQLALLDELYGYILPIPGANVLYSDATKMGVTLIDYHGVTAQLNGVANNQRTAIDNQRAYRGAQEALKNLKCYETAIRAHSKTTPIPQDGSVARTSGNNVGRNANTNPSGIQNPRGGGGTGVGVSR